jgi:hypothetical protein
MWTALRKRLREVKALPVGRRFQSVHERQADAPAWVKPLVLGGAVLAFGIGVVLSIIPGPAFVFFGLAGMLLAIESAWVAKKLDRAEVAIRELIARFRRHRRAAPK